MVSVAMQTDWVRRGKGKDVQKLGVKAKSRGLDPRAWGEKPAGQRSPGMTSVILLPWDSLLSSRKDLPGR